jgi:hypothetical protein
VRRFDNTKQNGLEIYFFMENIYSEEPVVKNVCELGRGGGRRTLLLLLLFGGVIAADMDGTSRTRRGHVTASQRCAPNASFHDDHLTRSQDGTVKDAKGIQANLNFGTNFSRPKTQR